MNWLRKEFRLVILLILAFSVTELKASSQDYEMGENPQYLFADFVMSRVKMKNNQLTNAMMNYNTISGKMVFLKEKKYYDLTNYDMVDTVYLGTHVFIPVGKEFYELLLPGEVTLFVQHEGKLKGKPSAYGTTSDVSSNYYISKANLPGSINDVLPPDLLVEQKSVYWLKKNDTFLEFYNEKQFLKLFPETAEQLKVYIKENRLKVDRMQDLIKLVDYCNSLAKNQ